MFQISHPIRMDDREIEVTVNKDGHGAKVFMKDNFMQYKFAINSWLALVEDITPGYYLVNQYIRMSCLDNGLIDTVHFFTSLSKSYLDSVESANTPLEIFIGKYGGEFKAIVHAMTLDSRDTTEVTQRILQICNYLARFTVVTESFGEKSIEKWKAVNARCMSILQPHYSSRYSVTTERRDPDHPEREPKWPTFNLGSCLKVVYRYTPCFSKWPSYFLRENITYELEAILGKKPLYRTHDGFFSSGVTADGARTTVDKCNAYAVEHPNWDGNPLHSTGVPCEHAQSQWKQLATAPVLRAVPKTMDTRRVIAPEPISVAYLAQGGLESLRERLNRTHATEYINVRRIDPSKDETNRELAQLGSLTGEWCTIDLSGASDSIARDLFFAVLPKQHRPFFWQYMSDYVKHKGEWIRLYTLYTSGNPLCWDTEAVLFLAIARFSCRLAGIKDYRSKCYAYGDDIIIPSLAYETCVDALEALGFVVNKDKSYAKGLFRESCGAWCFGGELVTPVFWPRREATEDDLQSLCQLQHRLFCDYPRAASVIEDGVRDLKPSMSYSPVGEECDDLWSIKTPSQSESEPHWVVREVKRDASSIPFDHYVYMKYLKYGPLYESKLDELLHISSSRRTALLPGENQWVKKRPLYGRYSNPKK